MTNYNDEVNLPFDFESLPEAMAIDDLQVKYAVEFSRSIANFRKRWQTYLNVLAWSGFVAWIESCDRSLAIDSDNCSVKHPQYANFIDGVFNLQVGRFKVCLLTNGVAIDESIAVSQALIDLPVYAAHVYVAIDVLEEERRVKVDSFIRYDEISQYKRSQHLSTDEDWIYELPCELFDRQPDNLLLYLRCLEPTAIALPKTTTVEPKFNLDELQPLISQLSSPSVKLPEVLTWSQAAAIFSDFELLTWLYELQIDRSAMEAVQNSFRDRLSVAKEQTIAPAINVCSWLSGQLDRIAAEMAWILLPVSVFAPSGWRNIPGNRDFPAAEFEAIITKLRDLGENIPTDARGACQEFELATHGLRLYAVIWKIVEAENVSGWSLLLVLGAQPNHYLPLGLKLELKENDTLLDTKFVTEKTDDSYLYTRVIGSLEEQFTVSVTLNKDIITFPNFVFN